MALALLFLFAACTFSQPRALVVADGVRRWVALGEAETVAELLPQAGVMLGVQDQVEPPSFTLLQSGMTVRVVRVRQRELSAEVPLPYSRTVQRDASLPQGESRLIQPGQDGRALVWYGVTLHDGQEVAREELRRETLAEPMSEVLVVGTRGSGTAVPFAGTIAYLEQGNAWVMRGDSLQKRPLTRTGDLDGHVLALSPDGRWLLFTRQPLGGASGQGGPLNALWLADTRITNDEPRSLEIPNVLWAGWQPCPNSDEGCPLQVAFSTAERVPTPPGWRAHNDLHRFGLNTESARGEVVPVRPPASALLGWWGRAWAWSPDGAWLAWGDATRVGLVEVRTGDERILAQFPPFETLAPWVWTPQLAWAPDSQVFAATVHRAVAPVEATDAPAERVERFDILRVEPAASRAEPLVEEAGPFALPQWLDADRLLYAQVEDRAHSVTSRYTLMVHEEGEVPRQLFPPPGQPGLDVPWSAWNRADEAVLTIWQGDLYLVPLEGGLPRPLTAEGGASRPQWGE